jgi:hypothetical protein
VKWTAALGGEVCGGCRVAFQANNPIALLTAKKLLRCELCVKPTPVDQAAVDAVIAERETERLRQIAGQVTKPGKAFAPMLPLSAAAESGLNELLKNEAGIVGVRRSRPVNPRPPQPHATVAHIRDHRARAVND